MPNNHAGPTLARAIFPLRRDYHGFPRQVVEDLSKEQKDYLTSWPRKFVADSGALLRTHVRFDVAGRPTFASARPHAQTRHNHCQCLPMTRCETNSSRAGGQKHRFELVVGLPGPRCALQCKAESAICTAANDPCGAEQHKLGNMRNDMQGSGGDAGLTAVQMVCGEAGLRVEHTASCDYAAGPQKFLLRNHKPATC